MINFNRILNNSIDNNHDSPTKITTSSSTQLDCYNDDIKSIVQQFQDSDNDIHYIQNKNFSHHELVYQILLASKETGFYMTFASYAFTEIPTRTIGLLKDSGIVSKINLLADIRSHANHPGILQQLYQICDTVAIDKVHAKVCVLTNKNCSITFLGSANWTTNQRFEFGLISKSKHLANFYKDFIIHTINIHNENRSRTS